MHDLSGNKYLDFTPIALKDYNIAAFLYKDFAMEKRTTTERVIFAVSGLLSMMRFNFRLSGYKYLAALVSMYIVKSDYTYEGAIKNIAFTHGTSADFVTANLQAALTYNPDFFEIASSAFAKQIILDGPLTIEDAVEILGAIFKIYYNYTVDDETFDFEIDPVVDLTKIDF